MKKSYIFILIFIIFILFITIVGCNMVTGNIIINKDRDILDIQSNKEVYFVSYGYSIDNPNIIINPYGNSPLTAIVMFETDSYSEVSICIKDMEGNCNISYTFERSKYHMIPIYGLYPNYNNTILIKCEGKEKNINIKTDPLPDDFGNISTSLGNFTFYNDNYPYAVDDRGNVRWYFNKKYYGNITVYDDNIILGSDSYNDNGTSISIYKMNLLGKIFNEYLLSDGYYGYSDYNEGNIYAISKDILVIDSQTGTITSKYINNNYNYISAKDSGIILGNDDKYYMINSDNEYEECTYNKPSNVFNFYDNVSNYKIVPGIRYGKLDSTKISDKNISIIKYTTGDISSIEISMDVNRITINNEEDDTIYVIFDKLFDKRIYEVKDIKYINLNGLKGKYTIYYKIKDKLYKTDYYIEV